VATRFHFKLLAQSYSAPGVNVQRPFEITMDGNDDRIANFRNRSFKETPLDGDGPPVAADTDGGSSDGAGSIQDLAAHGIKAATITLLVGAEYELIVDVLGDGDDDDEIIEALTDVAGIGEPTATKILAACKAAADKE
jgi:hypothetical protein